MTTAMLTARLLVLMTGGLTVVHGVNRENLSCRTLFAVRGIEDAVG
jgi:hypothetical protein